MPFGKKKHFFIILLSVFLFPAIISAATVSYNWNPVVVGGGGFVTGIVYHPAISGLAYCRTDMGGAYRRDTAGGPWLPITDFLDRTNSDYMGILSIAVDPSDGNRVYCMTGKYTDSWAGNGAVLTSANRGATWTIVPLTFKVGGNEDGRGCGERLVVDPNLGSILFMGSSGDTVTSGLWKSTNYGAAWAQVGAFNTTANMNFVIFDKSSATAGNPTQRIFAATNNTGGQSLWVSTNGGTSWAAVAGQPNGLMAVRADISNGYLYSTWSNNVGPNNATAGAVWRYQISSATWTNISPVVGPAYGYSGISVDAQNPQHIMVSTFDLWWPYDQVWRTTNGGTSWTALMWNPANNAIIATLDYSLSPWGSIRTPHWVAALAIDPFNSARADFGTGYGMFSCDNVAAATTAWQFRNLQLEEMVPLEIISPPSGALLLSACGDQGVFRHDSLIASPAAGVALNVGTSLSIDFAETVPGKIVAAYNSPSPYGAYSTNGGTSWTTFASAPGGASGGGSKCIAVSANGNNIVWSPPGAAESYSANNGGSWTACGGGVPAGYMPESDRVNSNKFYVYDAVNGRLWYTSASPATFAQSATAYPVLPGYNAGNGTVSAVFGREGDIWITTGAGGLYHSTDSGVTGTKVNTVTEAYMAGFGKASGAYPAVYLHGIVGGVLGIFRSDDTGATWSRINDASHQYGWLHNIKGDQNVYGRCYISAEGRGISYGVPAGASTPTFTPTRTRTMTNTPVPTATYTRTGTPTFTRTSTPANTATYTRTGTPTFTRTSTPANTATYTVTGTPTFTRTATPTSTRTSTPANTFTFTATPTGTFTRTSTPVNTSTFTGTPSASATATSSASASVSPSATASVSPTNSYTRTPTFTNTRTPTSSVQPTNTSSVSPSNTYTRTPSATFTRTDTPVNTSTFTATQPGTFTRTSTPANTATYTRTPTGTFTRTVTPVNTSSATASVSPTFTNTRTPTSSAVPTSTFTVTQTATATRTNSPVNTSTYTGTPTGTFTRTGTPVNTSTNTPVNTLTYTRTMTLTTTRTQTFTISPTSSASPTGTPPSPTNTPTYTISPVNSATFTSTRTATLANTATFTSTRTNTAVNTATDTPVNTGTNTPVNTATDTSVNTATGTATRTSTPVNTSTASRTVTPTMPSTPTRTRTSTGTFTATSTESPDYSPTSTSSVSDTPTGTPPTSTDTPSITKTETELPTESFTPSVTSTGSPVPSATSSRTVTFTYTRTSTASASATASVSPTTIYTITETRTASVSPVNTYTRTPTFQVPSATGTATPSFTVSATASVYPQSTLTITITLTRTTLPATPTQTVTLTPTTGINDRFEILDPVIFPNPYLIKGTNLSISFDITRPADKITIWVYTTAFRKVMEASAYGTYLHKSVATFQATAFGRLASGVYYAVVKGGNSGEYAVSKPVEMLVLR